MASCWIKPSLHNDDTVAQSHSLSQVVGNIDKGGVDLLAQLDDLSSHLITHRWKMPIHPTSVTGERLIIGSWKPAPFLKMKKAGILMASRHKNPGRIPNDNFLKTLYKISTLFSDFP